VCSAPVAEVLCTLERVNFLLHGVEKNENRRVIRLSLPRPAIDLWNCDLQRLMML
jgi:hypothetical protein